MDIAEQQANIERKYSKSLSALKPAYRPGAIRAISAAESMADALNELNFDNRSFAFAVGRQHRTLQQSIMRVLVAVALELAEAEASGKFDLRNEAACKLAVEISKLKTGLPFV